MEELTPRAAAKKYGALIPPHVRLLVGSRPKSQKSTSSRGSVQAGNEQLGVPDKHEFFNHNYANYLRMHRRYTRRRPRKSKAGKTNKK